MSKINIFVDMDGVLAVYDKNIVEVMYDEGHFLHCKPHKGNVSLMKELLNDKELNVFILSSLLADSPYIEKEKNEWLDIHIPEVTQDQRIFVPEGTHKSDHIFALYPDFVNQVNVLIDDYTVNLMKWKDAGFIGLKMLNGINNSNGMWLSQNPQSYLNFKANPKHNYFKITKILKDTIK